MSDGALVFTGFVAGMITTSVLWMLWMGLVMSKVQADWHDERLTWRHLTDDEKAELDDEELAKHWEEPWRS